MFRVYSAISRLYFVAATIMLVLLALVLFGSAVWTVIDTILAGAEPVDAALDAIGILIIGFAVVETAKFIAEEEIIRQRELRSPRESRRSLTKFITIIVIAASLEALVMVFKTSRDSIAEAIYPATLFIAATVALVALGVYQWFSTKIEEPDEPREMTPED